MASLSVVPLDPFLVLLGGSWAWVLAKGRKNNKVFRIEEIWGTGLEADLAEGDFCLNGREEDCLDVALQKILERGERGERGEAEES